MVTCSDAGRGQGRRRSAITGLLARAMAARPFGVHEWPAKDLCPVFFFRQESAGSALRSTGMKSLCTERKGAAGASRLYNGRCMLHCFLLSVFYLKCFFV